MPFHFSFVNSVTVQVKQKCLYLGAAISNLHVVCGFHFIETLNVSCPWVLSCPLVARWPPTNVARVQFSAEDLLPAP